MLMTALSVLETVHEGVFSVMAQAAPAPPNLEPSFALWDVRNVMSEERQKVLTGVSIVFSRVIPLEMDPCSHPLWKMAEQFGAKCSVSCSEDTTHVVAGTRGTEKVHLPLLLVTLRSNLWPALITNLLFCRHSGPRSMASL